MNDIPALLYLLLVMLVDFRTRRFPIWLGVIGLGVCLIAQEPQWLLGAFCGFVLGFFADVPGGDLRFLTIFGAMIGPVGISWAAIGAFSITVIAWNHGLTWVPWTVYIGLVYPLYSLIHSLFIPLFIKVG